MCLGTTLLTIALSAVPAKEAVVKPGETLGHVAKRVLGDERSATELKALNGLQGDEVRSGTALKLPGPERADALSALHTAQATVAQSKVAGPLREQAESRLHEAERLFSEAKYREAKAAADAAWSIVSEKDSHVSVDVAAGGSTTQVSVLAGPPVEVSAQGQTVQVAKGERLRVEQGKPPPTPEALTLGVPSPQSPKDKAKLELGANAAVELSWTPVNGATQYEVEVAQEKGRTWKVSATVATTRMQALGDGRYTWQVRALDGERQSEPSPKRAFELRRKLSIEAKTPSWQKTQPK